MNQAFGLFPLDKGDVMISVVFIKENDVWFVGCIEQKGSRPRQVRVITQRENRLTKYLLGPGLGGAIALSQGEFSFLGGRIEVVCFVFST